jgi:hypothetical protein
MSLTKLAFLTCGVSLALASMVYAEDVISNEWRDRQAFFLNPAGKITIVNMTDAGHAMMMKDARPLEGRVMIYRSGGKFYLLEDKKMPDGTMMFDRFSSYYN